MKENMVKLENVSKAYKLGERTVYGVRDLNLKVEKGEFAVAVGPSGCGKTTLLNLIGGIDNPTDGSVKVGSREISDLDDNELTDFRKNKVGFVFQFFNLISTLTAQENVELALRLRGVEGSKMRDEAQRYLELVRGIDFKDRFPSELSGGEQQRVAIARALAKQPALLLVDEPTGNLDVDISRQVMSALIDSTEELGTTTLLVTHDLPLSRVGDRILKLKDGQIDEDMQNENKIPPEDLEW